MAKQKSIKRVKPTPTEITPEGMKWVYGAQLVEGDVLRTTVGSQDHPKYGQYAYAICNGGGFGCNPDALGNAIFVHSVDFDLNAVMSHKNDVRQKDPIKRNAEGNEIIELFPDPKTLPARQPGHYRSYDVDRWERFWGILALRPV